MKCGRCDKLLHYREEIVALQDTGTGVIAVPEIELEAGTVEGGFEAVGKYHVRCYAAMREQKPDEWPELPESGEASA
jgi:hypothetical protein